MQEFIGTKLIVATPMNRRDYNTYRGWELPKNENGDDGGFLVEYADGSTPNDSRHSGYISWSPAEQFENTYQSIERMNFGHAIEMLKRGHAVARAGWNSKGMFLYLVPAASYPAQTPIAVKHWDKPGSKEGDPRPLVPYGAYIAMKTATGEVVPWIASQTDVLADDWSVVSVTPQA